MKQLKMTLISTTIIGLICISFLSTFAWATAPYTIIYDFGDGTVGTDTTHTYIDPGLYTLTVTVTDVDGFVKSAIQSIVVTELSFSPDTPTLTSPANNATSTSLTPTLTTSAFSDDNSNDIHLGTVWQLSESSTFTTLILSGTSYTNRTTLTVPGAALDEGTTYYWRAQHYDQDINGSGWSNTSSFTTLTTNNDTNINGIPDIQEVSASTDMDNDGEPDNQQDDIKSLTTEVGGGQFGISRKTDPTINDISKVESINPETISDVSMPYSMPLGMVSAKLDVEVGSTVYLTIYFSDAAPDEAIWLINDSINGWTDYSDYATFSSDRMSVVLQLQDGGHGDSDGTANGTIVDPGGYGLASFISGTVMNSRGATLTNAEITLTRVIEGLTFSLKSIQDGTFFSVLLPGDYTVDVSATGYSSTSRSVTIPEATLTTSLFFSLTSNITAPTQTTGIDGSTVTVSWNSVSGATSYTLYYAPYPYLGEHTISSIDMGSSTSISVVLPSGAAYYVAITSTTAGVESGYSNIGLIQMP